MIKINLGCGKRNFGKDWVHIDGGDHSHLDYKDIFNLPYESNSVDLIYASHLIEYFDRAEVVNIIKKWKSKLKAGGILRIAVPDFGQMAFLYLMKRYPLENFLGPLYGKMKMSSETIYHKTTYDFKSLKSLLLSECGFLKVSPYDWRSTSHSNYDDHSQSYLPHMDKENGTIISLNVEATK